MEDRLQNILAYLLDHLVEKELDCRRNKTYITKLLYLIEIYHYRRTRERLTNLSWKFWFFGPYAEEIENVAQEATGNWTTYLSFSREELPEKPNIDPQSKGDIQRVVADFCNLDLPRLLDFVYFKTEPMIKAQRRGDFLNFETISPPRKEIEVDITKKEMNELKDRLKGKTLKLGKFNRTPEPKIIERYCRYEEDEIYNFDLESLIDSEVYFEDQ